MVGFAVVALVVRSSSKKFGVCACDLGRSVQFYRAGRGLNLPVTLPPPLSRLRWWVGPAFAFISAVFAHARFSKRQKLRGLESRGLPRESNWALRALHYIASPPGVPILCMLFLI